MVKVNELSHPLCASVLSVLVGALALAVPFAAQPQDAVNRVPSRAVIDPMARNQRATVPAEMSKKGADVVLQMKDQSLKVSNPSVLAAQVRQLPVDVVLTPDAAGQPQVESMNLQATEAWKAKTSATKSRYESVTQAHLELEAIAQRALANDSTPQDLRDLDRGVKSAQQTIIDAYKQLPQEARREQRDLVEQHRELQTASKALYGVNRDDRYPPAAYTRIYENSRSAFALAVVNEATPRCSAVLIGNALALTNNHCLLENIPEELEARFDFESDLDGNLLTQRVFPVVDFQIATEEARGKLDFVLLQLGTDPSGKLPGEYYRPQCLSTKNVSRDDALYVIGHPLGGPRTVHDNAFVYFPFRVTPEQLLELEILVRSEFDSFEAEDASYREGKLKEFKDSYLEKSEDNATWYEYYSARFGNQPTIGADCDTYRGNSGSPVYDRHSHYIVGLLFDGQEDLGQPWKPGWRAHEAILPIGMVLSQIKATLPDWNIEGSGVCLIP